MRGGSEVQGGVFARDGARGGASVSAGEPDTVGMTTLCIELGQAFVHRLAARPSTGMLLGNLFSKFILFWKFCCGNLWGGLVFVFISFFLSLLRQCPFHHCICTIGYWCSGGITDVKHSRTLGNINKAS